MEIHNHIIWLKKPHWEVKHDWWEEDFKMEIDMKNKCTMYLRKYADEEIGNYFRETIKLIDKRIKQLQKEYKKIYGVRFNLNRVKEKNE